MHRDAVIPHGGTRPRPTSELRSPVLRRHGLAIAASSYDRIYAAWPDLAARYGERGRQLTAEDNLWHLNFLDAAILLGDSAHFHRYADWLQSFLLPRGLIHAHISGAFRFLADAIEALDVPADEQAHRDELVGLLRDTADRVDMKVPREPSR